MGIFIGNPIDEVKLTHRSILKKYQIKIKFLHNSPKEIKQCILIFFYITEEYNYEDRLAIRDRINNLREKNGFPIISLLPQNDLLLVEFLYKELGVYPCTSFDMENVLKIENIFFKKFESYEKEFEEDTANDPTWENIYIDEFSNVFRKYVICI